MAVHQIRIVGDPVLRMPTRPVTEVDRDSAALRQLVEDMFETNTAANGVGLAAPQIGVDLRVFVYDCPDYDQPGAARQRGHVINPVLKTDEVPQTMPDPEDDLEGCLSVPGETFPTGRAERATVTGTDLDGNPVEVSGTGFFARCLQHETDHLDGLLYLDRLTGRYVKQSRRALKERGWGAPGLSWDPSTEPDPFA